jgi:hypothetical protein
LGFGWPVRRAKLLINNIFWEIAVASVYVMCNEKVLGDELEKLLSKRTSLDPSIYALDAGGAASTKLTWRLRSCSPVIA